MSNVIRQTDSAAIRVADMEFDKTMLGSPHPGRPRGGFAADRDADAPSQYMNRYERLHPSGKRIIEDARRKAEEIGREAYHAGFEQGERAGQKLATQKIESTCETFSALIDSIHRQRAELIEGYESELIKVALAIATRVVGKTIELEPDVLARVVQDVLEKVSEAKSILIYVSAHDEQLIGGLMEQHTGRPWPPEHVTVQVDDSVGRGGCKVVADTGALDATIETKLLELKAQLCNDGK